MRVIKDDAVIDDGWVRVADEEPVPAEGDVIVGFDRWRAERAALGARRGRLGVAFRGDQDLAALAADLPNFALVGLEFPRFTDGRNYSIARLLRERHGYTGELRALGNVLHDQLYYMRRCGIDSFAIDPRHDPAQALAGLRVFSVRYQPAGDDAPPIWRQRA